MALLIPRSGLLGALLVGATIGRSLGWALNIPTIGMHHMEGHLLAPLLESNSPTFPFLALLVSGGHTQLVKVARFGDYEVLVTRWMTRSVKLLIRPPSYWD